jgi:hypothetical protein
VGKLVLDGRLVLVGISSGQSQTSDIYAPNFNQRIRFRTQRRRRTFRGEEIDNGP